jgi:hypothetical protein
MRVTLFGDMTEEVKMTDHDFDHIYGKSLEMRYATLKEPHLFVQYPGEFTAVERWEWD